MEVGTGTDEARTIGSDLRRSLLVLAWPMARMMVAVVVMMMMTTTA